MQEVSGGNLDAMAILFERYHKWIYNFLYQMEPDEAVCEDLTQNVFYKAMRYRTSYKGGKFSSWIFKITRNVFSDHIKKKKPNVTLENLVLVEDESKEDLSNEVRRLRIVLNMLPVGDKELIIMSRFQGMKYHQIADVIGSNEIAVKTRVHRIIKKMKTIYFEKNTL